jgi:hypothetical protein
VNVGCGGGGGLRQHCQIVDDRSYAGDSAGVVAGQGPGGWVGSGTAQGDDAVVYGDLDVLAGERVLGLKLCLDLAGELLVGRRNLMAAPTTGPEQRGEEGSDEQGLSHADFLSEHMHRTIRD